MRLSRSRPMLTPAVRRSLRSATVSQQHASSAPRLFVDADRPAVAALQLESWVDTYGEQADPQYIDALPELVDSRWRSLTFGPREFVMVCDDATRLAGFVTVLDRSSHAWVDNMHVAPAARRHGAGRALMAAAAQQMAFVGYDSMRLTVLETNERARAFYAALGGNEVGQYEVSFVGRQLQAIELEWTTSRLLLQKP
mgnify:CR=1 FL=1